MATKKKVLLEQETPVPENTAPRGRYHFFRWPPGCGGGAA